jgi:OOP family OmpA-OmpF porin
MRQLKKIMFVAMLTAIFISSTYAKEKKAYVGLSLGQSDYSDTDSGLSKPIGYDIFVGYKFNKYVALEGEFRDFGKAKKTENLVETSYTLTEAGISVIGSYPINKVSLFAKLGMHSWILNYENTGPGFSRTGTESGTNMFYGIGADYEITKRVSVRLDYNKYELKLENNDKKYKIAHYSLGASYKF